MNEQDRERLSALMDGEAGELEVRQALRAAGDDEALAATWRRYHLARAALRGERQALAGADLRAAVASRLDAEPAPARPRAAWLAPLASIAVAASVAVVTVFAWQAFRDAGNPFAAQGETVAAAGAESGQQVALGPMVVVRADGEELVMPGGTGVDGGFMPAADASPTASQDRLNTYLTRHAQAAGAANARGLAPYARVVSLEGEQGP